jgi:hypothetical protein
MTYAEVKALKLSGESVTVEALDAAILDQTVVVARATSSFAKHLAKLGVADQHPFPLPTDQEGRVGRRAVLYQQEFSRLVRLHAWKELALNGVTR